MSLLDDGDFRAALEDLKKEASEVCRQGWAGEHIKIGPLQYTLNELEAVEKRLGDQADDQAESELLDMPAPHLIYRRWPMP